MRLRLLFVLFVAGCTHRPPNPSLPGVVYYYDSLRDSLRELETMDANVEEYQRSIHILETYRFRGERSSCILPHFFDQRFLIDCQNNAEPVYWIDLYYCVPENGMRVTYTYRGPREFFADRVLPGVELDTIPITSFKIRDKLYEIIVRKPLKRGQYVFLERGGRGGLDHSFWRGYGFTVL